ncbi:hypothetical protein [Cupriavidus consociatus]|uniref:hypothetical protein n=1 Tax=Cupriavidus consociatus TaxID=2821357 RepID=UPI001AE235AF|nr:MULTISPECIES: hypothetical protein [unclassified Cupriavidus]MBP0622924.1 hypothetical protein [Cupriavidus sp. LEh25]MDK2659612.1 hypothetical protein [Cupriavidus sp. LEh21]
MQLLHYCGKKTVEHPDWSGGDTLLALVEEGIRSKQTEWDLGGTEVDWIVTRVRTGYSKVG